MWNCRTEDKTSIGPFYMLLISDNFSVNFELINILITIWIINISCIALLKHMEINSSSKQEILSLIAVFQKFCFKGDLSFLEWILDFIYSAIFVINFRHISLHYLNFSWLKLYCQVNPLMTSFWKLWMWFNTFRRGYEMASISVPKFVLFWPTGNNKIKDEDKDE